MEAFFKDPFNEVRGVSAIQRIFAAMFSQVRLPRFRVLRAVQSGKAPHWEREAFLTWEFDFYLQNYATQQLQTIRGSTHLQFNEDGRIIYHRDYWDAAEELYEKLPILGGLMRWLKRRAQH